ncbi:MAG: hypothetical protein AAFW84_03770 [Cyanobacteria bacterium J06635_15]
MTQEASLDFRLVKRICHLQQALDQAMYSLAELRLRVQSQQFVESQLAKTENFANAQQKAIALLQHQLTQKHHWQTRMLHEFAAAIDSVLDRQYRSLTRLKILLQRSEIDIQNYLLQLQQRCGGERHMAQPSHQPRVDLEAEVYAARMLTVNLGTQLNSICQSVQDIEQTVTQHQLHLTRMEASLQPLNLTLEASSSNNVSLADINEADQSWHPSDQTSLGRNCDDVDDTEALALASSPQAIMFELFHEVKTTQLKVDVLEAELTEQLRQHSHLRQRCQTLAAERDYYKQQMLNFQQQLIALQRHRQSLSNRMHTEVLPRNDAEFTKP